MVRGLNSNPGAYCYLGNKRLKIYEVEKIIKDKNTNNYGCISSINKDGFLVECLDGYVKVLDLAIEGRKRCKSGDFLNGIDKDKLIGSVLSGEKG